LKFFRERDFGTRISPYFPENEGTKDFALEKGTKAPEGTGAGAGTGAVAGGVLGWLVGIGAHWQFLVWVHFLPLTQSSLR
jgi:hypothetical protein